MIKSFARQVDYDIPTDLQKYIVAVIQGESTADIHTTYPVFPNGYTVIINIYSDIPTLYINNRRVVPQERLYVAGQIYDADISIELNGKFGQIGFLLHPTATYYLFHKSGDYFLNRWRSFKEVTAFCPFTDLDNLSNSNKPLQNIEMLIRHFQKLSENRLPAIEWLDQSINEIFKRNGNISLTALSDQSKISERHFRRKFKEVVGVSPKYYCKVVQLNAIFDWIKANQVERLHHLALDYGYYDQAHFINDFKKLIGDTPDKFLLGEYEYVKTYMGIRREGFE